MRELIGFMVIGLALITLLYCAIELVPSRRPYERHPAPGIPVLLFPSVHATPWPSPEPEHVTARRAWHYEERTEPRLSYRASQVTDAATIELRAIKERRLAVELAAIGEDYPYSYPGAPFPRSAFVSTGATA